MASAWRQESPHAEPGPHFATLAEALAGSAVDARTLRKRFGIFLRVAQRVLGITPDCYQWMAIWSVPAGRTWTGRRRWASPCVDTYNTIMPGCLNLPPLLRPGYRLKEIIGLVILAASIASGCRYCQAHSCTFALRRGVDDELIYLLTKAIGRLETTRRFDARELAAIRVAYALGMINTTAKLPSGMTPELRRDLERHYAPDEVEWIVWAASLMGYLNKWMDATGVPLEEPMLSVAGRAMARESGDWEPGKHAPAGWQAPREPDDWKPAKDSAGTWLGLFPLAPKLVLKNAALTRGVPGGGRALGRYLLGATGYHWPEVTQRRHASARKAVGAMLAWDADPRTTTVGLGAKAAAAQVYAAEIGDDWLSQVAETLATHAWQVERRQGTDYWHRIGGDHTAAATTLVRQISASPSAISPEAIARAKTQLADPQLVELVHSTAKNQLVHRLAAYHRTPVPRT